MGTQTAKVLQSSMQVHPRSSRHLLCVLTDAPFEVGGEKHSLTQIWIDPEPMEAGDPQCPEQIFGEAVQWGTHHAWVLGVRYHKPETDDGVM